MEEFIIEPKEDALKIVFGEKFDDFLFNDVIDQISESKISEMKEALGRKDNQLVLLDAQKLDILCNTLDNPQTTEEKAAYNLLVEAVDEKIRAFAEGKNDLSGEEIDPMLSLIQRRTKDAKEVANPEMYNMAINKAVATGQRYDAENGLSDVTKDRINLIDANLKKMESWQSDVTNLDDSPENCLVNIPEDRFVEFVQKRINGKENVTFADLQSALLAADRYKKSDGVKNSIIKQAEDKVKKSMNSKEFLSSSEVAPAKYIYDVLQKADRKTAKASKGFDKKINKSIERNKGVKVFETIDKIVQNTEVTGNPKIIGR
ncbi:MAG: hypothetical protein IKA30_04390, partial [Alphaproteobacteria bacterium]|nr:hypothetical protein [Alphaproteobacteria bacterium]